jgi:hypothetical protein
MITWEWETNKVMREMQVNLSERNFTSALTGNADAGVKLWSRKRNRGKRNIARWLGSAEMEKRGGEIRLRLRDVFT